MKLEVEKVESEWIHLCPAETALVQHRLRCDSRTDPAVETACEAVKPFKEPHAMSVAMLPTCRRQGVIRERWPKRLHTISACLMSARTLRI